MGCVDNVPKIICKCRNEIANYEKMSQGTTYLPRANAHSLKSLVLLTLKELATVFLSPKVNLFASTSIQNFLSVDCVVLVDGPCMDYSMIELAQIVDSTPISNVHTVSSVLFTLKTAIKLTNRDDGAIAIADNIAVSLFEAPIDRHMSAKLLDYLRCEKEDVEREVIATMEILLTIGKKKRKGESVHAIVEMCVNSIWKTLDANSAEDLFANSVEAGRQQETKNMVKNTYAACSSKVENCAARVTNEIRLLVLLEHFTKGTTFPSKIRKSIKLFGGYSTYDNELILLSNIFRWVRYPLTFLRFIQLLNRLANLHGATKTEVTKKATEMSEHLLGILKMQNVENARDFTASLITKIHRKAYYSIIVMCSKAKLDGYKDTIYEELRRGNTHPKIMPPPGLTESDAAVPHSPSDYDAKTSAWMEPPAWVAPPAYNGDKTRSRASSSSSSTLASINGNSWSRILDEKSDVIGSPKTKHVSLTSSNEPNVLAIMRDRNERRNAGVGYTLKSPLRLINTWLNRKRYRK